MEEEIYATLTKELNLTAERRAELNGWKVVGGVLYPGEEEEEDVGRWEDKGQRFCTAVQVFDHILRPGEDVGESDLRLHLALRTAERQSASVLSLEGEGKRVPESFAHIAAALVRLSSLRILQISDFTDIGTAISCLVRLYFSQSPQLKSLIINHGSCGQLYELCAGLEQLPVLETLNLSDVALGHTGVLGIAPFLQERTLRYLNVSACALGDEGFMAITRCFQGALAALQSLIASHNEITAVGIRGLSLSILGVRMSLETLDLSHNSLEDAGLQLLLKLLTAKSMPKLRSLHITRCNIKTYGILLLSHFLAQDEHLRELNVSDNAHSCDWMTTVSKPLLTALQSNTRLRVLVMSVPQQLLAEAKLLFSSASSQELSVKYEIIKLTYRPAAGFRLLNGNKEVLCIIFECLWGTREPRKCILLPVVTHHEPACKCTH